jgi:DNA helicase II / ATP-dependent DNA helicase PcrA
MFVWTPGDLNPKQEAAIEEPGSVFLVACPGSGKTRTLTYKIARLLSTLKSEKQWVIAITYTHRAADEIEERIERLGVDTSQLWIGTIHSFCLDWIIRPYALYHPDLRDGFKVIDSYDAEMALTDLCAPYAAQRITYWDCGYHFTPAGRVLACAPAKRAAVGVILDRFHAQLKANRQIDYELILWCAYDLIVKQPTIGILLNAVFATVLVDEYQDTKEIQYAILAEILKAGGRKTTAFVVGDPNQAIYGSLGGYAIAAAQLSAMANVTFREMELSQNYRSSERIVGYFANYNVHDTTIEAAAKHKDHTSLVSFDTKTAKEDLEQELVRLIRHSAETLGIPHHEICIVAPQWVHLAGMTRRLVAVLPDYRFDGPGMVPFARDIDNFWYKLSRIVLTEASPGMYVRRLRWAGEVLSALDDAGASVSNLSRKAFLRECNSVAFVEADGLTYLRRFFDLLFVRIGIDYRKLPALVDHHQAFFESSQARIDRLKKEGSAFIGEIANFRRVFESRSGITVSTIHGVKGAEFDTVIAYALLEGMVPHFADPAGAVSANKLLYVIASRARKHLHLIAERGRMRGGSFGEYKATTVLAVCGFAYDTVP